MCLGVPGKVVELSADSSQHSVLERSATVDFGGVTRQVSLALIDDVQPGQFVIVHVGFAISVVDEQEAQRIFSYLDEIDELEGVREEI